MTNSELCEAVRGLPEEMPILIADAPTDYADFDGDDLKRLVNDYERLLAAAKAIMDYRQPTSVKNPTR